MKLTFCLNPPKFKTTSDETFEEERSSPSITISDKATCSVDPSEYCTVAKTFSKFALTLICPLFPKTIAVTTGRVYPPSVTNSDPSNPSTIVGKTATATPAATIAATTTTIAVIPNMLRLEKFLPGIL